MGTRTTNVERCTTLAMRKAEVGLPGSRQHGTEGPSHITFRMRLVTTPPRSCNSTSSALLGASLAESHTKWAALSFSSVGHVKRCVYLFIFYKVPSIRRLVLLRLESPGLSLSYPGPLRISKWSYKDDELTPHPRAR